MDKGLQCLRVNVEDILSILRMSVDDFAAEFWLLRTYLSLKDVCTEGHHASCDLRDST